MQRWTQPNPRPAAELPSSSLQKVYRSVSKGRVWQDPLSQMVKYITETQFFFSFLHLCSLLPAGPAFSRRLTPVQQRSIPSASGCVFGEHAGKRGWKTDVCDGCAASVPVQNGALSGTVKTAEYGGTMAAHEWAFCPQVLAESDNRQSVSWTFVSLLKT